MVLPSHVTNENNYISTTRVPMATKLGRMVAHLDGCSHKVTWLFDHVILQDLVTSQNHCISTITVPMTTKLGRMLTYLKGLLTIKSHNALITWSCKVTWQTKIIYSQPECLWLQTWQNDNSTWWVPTYKVTSPFDHVVLRDHVTN